MMTEGEFNSYLSNEFKKIPNIKALKTSDRFRMGVPDWILFRDGRAVVFECKFVKSLACKKKMALNYKLSPTQITMLKGFRRVYTPAWVLVYADDFKKMFLVHVLEVMDTGNIAKEVLANNCPSFEKDDIEGLVKYLFWEETPSDSQDEDDG